MAPRLTVDQVKALFEKINNWGRWGAEDQRGTLNLITPQKRAAAADLGLTGEIVSLALPLATEKSAENRHPVAHYMLLNDPPTGALMDYFAIASHGTAFTHLDALCHVPWQNKLYNGFAESEVGSAGANKCAIDVTRDGILSRGVLLDIPKLKKVEWLEESAAIYPEDLDAAEKLHAVTVEEGDILLIRTGRHQRRKATGSPTVRAGLAGLDASCLSWLHERGVALLGCDGVSDISPSPFGRDIAIPIHVGTLNMMGMHLLDNADLDALSLACVRHSRYEFLFVMAPLVLERATASPVNPLALF